MYGIAKYSLMKVFEMKLAKITKCRKICPVYTSFEEYNNLRSD